MRISPEITEFFKSEVKKVDSGARVYLFGSRIDDLKKGGDIDILILSEKKWDDDRIRKIRIKFYDIFGFQKLDLVNFTFDEENPFKDLIMDHAIML
ncbi:MAG: nucleotidyltransferase domain-containing protein [Bacteroidia bacterium]|nr:nucleotidyltransferase domain-containing protein [Bacteroidia bacterium]